MRILFALILTIGLVVPNYTLAQFHPLELLSTPNSGGDADGTSGNPSIGFSNDGRYVVFDSAAEDLVTGDDNNLVDVFLVDRDATEGSKVSRVSVDSDETDANGLSQNPSVSADGQYVVFESDASDLVAGDDNNVRDIFLRDTVNDTTIRVSVDSDGEEADGASIDARISSDGNFVVYTSAATDLVTGDTNGVADIFLYNRSTEETTRISVDSDELESDGVSSHPSINGDGTLIAFSSAATDLVTGDTNSANDIFLRNVTDGTTVIVSDDANGAASNGDSLNPFISDDGTLISFESAASDLIAGDDNDSTDIFLYTVASDSTIRVSGDGDDNAANSSISADNTFVTFQSDATDLVTGDTNDSTDVFAYTLSSMDITRLSVTDLGSELSSGSSSPTINANGQYIAYRSSDDELVSGDSNNLADIFLVDAQCLLSPSGVTPQDQDSDSTDDCNDACPEDASKIAAGDCGCGTADTDTDGDGTADCNDSCVDDSDKTEAGDCGCGVADSDSNGNGISDCLEFSSGTRPRKPSAFYVKSKRAIRVVIPQDIPGFRYLVQARQGKKVISTRRTGRTITKLKVRNASGTVSVRYKVIGVTKFSKSKKVKIKR